MKKSIFAFSMAALSLALFSCNDAQKKDNAETSTEVTPESSMAIDSVTLGWTGYKTTEKTPVKGVFKKVSIKDYNEEAATPEAYLDGAKVNITVASLFSGNEARDPKLIDIFFGNMTNTALLEGTLHLKDGKNTIEVTMNDVTKEVPVTTSFENNVFTVSGDVDVTNFGATKAVEELSKACYDLHTGLDGVSKTWSEAHFEGSVYFSK